MRRPAYSDRDFEEMILLVCGGRHFADEKLTYLELDKIHNRRQVKLLIHGGATGADAIADRWANLRGIATRVFRADWKKYDRPAGPIRNSLMLEGLLVNGPLGCMAIAFPGGAGTLDMVTKIKRARVRLVEVSCAV